MKMSLKIRKSASWILLPAIILYTFAPCFAYSQMTNGNSTLSTANCQLTIADNPFRFSGYYQDSESSLSYLQARYYSPDYNVFISRDTYDLWNRFAYCGGNPVMNSDPNGHDFMDFLQSSPWVAIGYGFLDIMAGDKAWGCVFLASGVITLVGGQLTDKMNPSGPNQSSTASVFNKIFEVTGGLAACGAAFAGATRLVKGGMALWRYERTAPEIANIARAAGEDKAALTARNWQDIPTVTGDGAVYTDAEKDAFKAGSNPIPGESPVLRAYRKAGGYTGGPAKIEELQKSAENYWDACEAGRGWKNGWVTKSVFLGVSGVASGGFLAAAYCTHQVPAESQGQGGGTDPFGSGDSGDSQSGSSSGSSSGGSSGSGSASANMANPASQTVVVQSFGTNYNHIQGRLYAND